MWKNLYYIFYPHQTDQLDKKQQSEHSELQFVKKQTREKIFFYVKKF